MAAPQEPQSLAARVRRLELMLMALTLSLGDEGTDEQLWFEFRNLLRHGLGRDRLNYPEFEYFLDRFIDSRRRSQLPSVHQKIDELNSYLRKTETLTQQNFDRFDSLKSEVDALRSKAHLTQIETHSLLAIQALGLPSEQLQLTRYVPVRAYIDETPEGAIGSVSAAVADVLAAFGFSVADEFPEVRGSWFKKWFARSKDVLSQPEVRERLEKIERAVELKGIDRPQAEVDEKQASAIAKLVKALDKVPNAAVQAGSVLVVKLTTPKGPVIQARTLTQEEMVELENNQLLLQDPAEVLGRLSAACAGTKKLPAAKQVAGEA